jgi:hypothetical protein
LIWAVRNEKSWGSRKQDSTRLTVTAVRLLVACIMRYFGVLVALSNSTAVLLFWPCLVTYVDRGKFRTRARTGARLWSPRVGILVPWRSLLLLLPVAGLGLGPHWLQLPRRVWGSWPLGARFRCCCPSPSLTWARVGFCFNAAIGGLGPLVLTAAAAARRLSWLGPALAPASTPRVGVLAPLRSLPLLLPVAGLGLGPRWLLILRRV